MSKLTKSYFERSAHERFREKRDDQNKERFKILNHQNLPRWYREGTASQNFLKLRSGLFKKNCTIVWEYQPKLQRRSLFISEDYIFDFMLKESAELSTVYGKTFWSKSEPLFLEEQLKIFAFLTRAGFLTILEIWKMSIWAISIHGNKMSAVSEEWIWKKEQVPRSGFKHILAHSTNVFL